MSLLTNCSLCKFQHALCWLQRKSGQRELGYFCNEKTVFRTGPHFTHHVRHTSFVKAVIAPENMPTPEQLAALPIHYTPQASKLARLKGQGQLPMMFLKPGETAERGVEFKPVDNPETIKAEIEQLVQAQKELQSQIEKLAKKKIALEKLEIEKRHKLREIYTEPLDLA